MIFYVLGSAFFREKTQIRSMLFAWLLALKTPAFLLLFWLGWWVGGCVAGLRALSEARKPPDEARISKPVVPLNLLF